MRARRKPEAKTCADEQVCPAPETVEGRQMRRGKTGTSLQHKMKSSIHHRVDPRISDGGASKVVGMTPGEPLCLRIFRSEQPAREAYRVAAVSRGHKSRRKRAGSSRRSTACRDPTKNPEDSPRQRRIRRTLRTEQIIYFGSFSPNVMRDSRRRQPTLSRRDCSQTFLN